MLRNLLTFSGVALSFAAGSTLAAYKKENDQLKRDVHELQRSRRGLGDVVPNDQCLKIEDTADTESCHSVTQAMKHYRIRG